MKSDKIVKLIADAFRVGKAEGYSQGYDETYDEAFQEGNEEGYDRGYGEGYEQALRDALGKEPICEPDDEDQDGPEFEITLDEDEEGDDDGECQCPMCTDPVAYDMGWNDGFVGETDLDEDMLKNTAYLAGYQCGAADRKDPAREIH